MKRVDLIRTIEGFGCALVRHGRRHDWYRNPNTGVSQPVPRHREIGEGLARHIIRMLSNPAGGGPGPQAGGSGST
jgi:mRNA interferase HicA